MTETKKRRKLNSEITRRQIRAFMDAGYSLSKIAKETGISYAHVKQIAAQEQPPQGGSSE